MIALGWLTVALFAAWFLRRPDCTSPRARMHPMDGYEDCGACAACKGEKK